MVATGMGTWVPGCAWGATVNPSVTVKGEMPTWMPSL